MEEAVKLTTLRGGIFKGIRLDYRPGRTKVASLDYESNATGRKSMKASPFTREQVLHEVQPLLAEIVKEKLDKLETSPLIDYRFTMQGTFATTDGPVKLMVLETFFLTRHLLDPYLFHEPEAARMIALFEVHAQFYLSTL